MAPKAHRPRSPLFFFSIIFFFGLTFFIARPREHQAPQRASTETVKSSHNQELEKFNLSGYDEKGKKAWNLEGDTAQIDIGDMVFLEDNVTLRLKNDTLIKTDQVQWSQDSGTLRTNAPVFVTHQATKVKGIGAIGKLNENFIQLNRDIEMVINPTARLTCQGPMKIFYNQNKMTFFRRVRVQDDKGTLTANRMDVVFDPEDKKIKEIIAVGRVTIQRGADTTRSERAIYNVTTGSVRLEGSPEIVLHKQSTELFDAASTNQSAKENL